MTVQGPTHLVFEHKLFAAVNEPYFRRLDYGEGETVLMTKLGNSEVALPIPGLKREFGIATDSADGKMLNLVIQSLDYVTALRPGDPIPPEVLSGEPSWDITDVHRVRATQRISMRLIAWLGGDIRLSDGQTVAELLAHPETRKRLNDAFSKAAVELGFGDGPEAAKQVIDLVGELADDLAAVEALRDQVLAVRDLAGKTQKLRQLYSGDRSSAAEVVDPVTRLMARATEDLSGRMKALDALSNDPLKALGNLEAKRKEIARARNDLYKRLHAWKPTLDFWWNLRAQRDIEMGRYLKDLYRFLAPRYAQFEEWNLNVGMLPSAGRKEMVW